MTKLLEEIMKLSSEERILLTDAILESVEHDAGPQTIDFEDESSWLQKKLDAQVLSPESVSSWAEMKGRILARV
jgi:hypothetical protein